MKISFKDGNTTITINTDSAAKTPEETNAVIADIEDAASRGLSRALGFNVRATLVRRDGKEQNSA